MGILDFLFGRGPVQSEREMVSVGASRPRTRPAPSAQAPPPDSETVHPAPEWAPIIAIVENTRQNILITGAAGTGKSELLRLLKKRRNKNYVILAPTGLAALTVGGCTIHGFFKFPPRILVEPQNLGPAPEPGHLTTIIIDEVSMVRCDLLDAIDHRLRKWFRRDVPFGGVQIVLIGDPYQLPPVVTETDRREFERHGIFSFHFFDSRVFQATQWKTFQLSQVWRQKHDVSFIDFLQRVRTGGNFEPQEIDAVGLQTLPDFEPTPQTKRTSLTYTNDVARAINDQVLRQINGVETCYFAEFTGKFGPTKLGKDQDSSYPFEVDLRLRTGARVVCCKNHDKLINGDMGLVVEMFKDEAVINFDRLGLARVNRAVWEKIAYKRVNGIVQPVVIGTAIQLPLRLAWAMTVHKAQGQTLPSIFIDNVKNAFAPGQAYVALSRSKNADGVALRHPLTSQDIFCDERVKRFMVGLETTRSATKGTP